MGIASRFPSLQDNLRVYAVIATLLSGWTVLWLFWQLPSWLYFLTVAEILPLFAYALAANFLESVLVLIGLNLLGMLLPRAWFRDGFVARSFWLVSPGLGYLMFFASRLGKEQEYPADMLRWMPLVTAACVVFSLLVGRLAPLRSVTERLADRLTIFLYLLVPLSVISLLVVILRNAW